MTTQGMWEMLSELLEGEKLPEPLNQDLYDLRDGKAFVVRGLTDEEIRKVADEVFKHYKNWHHYQIDFAKAILKKAS